MAACNYGCENLPAYLFFNCDKPVLGGSFSIGVLQCDHTITDFTNNVQLQQAIDNGDLVIAQGLKWEYPDPSLVENPNRTGCGPENELLGFDNIANIEDSNVSVTNNTFYEALNNQKTQLLLYNCQEQTIRHISQSVVWKARPATNPFSDRELQKYMITAAWFSAKDEFNDLFTADPAIWQSGV